MGAPPSEIRRKDDGNSREKVRENDDADDDNPFIIDAKHPSIERLKKWRQATLTVNATRRFRYTLDLKKLEERTRFTSPAAHLRAGTHVIRVQSFSPYETLSFCLKNLHVFYFLFTEDS
jgi:hypothetical protein